MVDFKRKLLSDQEGDQIASDLREHYREFCQREVALLLEQYPQHDRDQLLNTFLLDQLASTLQDLFRRSRPEASEQKVLQAVQKVITALVPKGGFRVVRQMKCTRPHLTERELEQLLEGIHRNLQDALKQLTVQHPGVCFRCSSVSVSLFLIHRGLSVFLAATLPTEGLEEAEQRAQKFIRDLKNVVGFEEQQP